MNISKMRRQLDQINCDIFESYLKGAGWVDDGDIEGLASIWHRPEKENYIFEVVLPRVKSVKGYLQRLYEALKSLAAFEERDIAAVIESVQNFYSDMVKVRVVHLDVEEGSIPLDDGVLLVEKARDLLAATTMSAFKKQKYFSGNRSQEVQAYLDKLRLGQTEVGSFIVNVLAPISNEVVVQEDSELISLGRAVTMNLARSLSAVQRSMESFKESEDFIHFEEAVSKGVSANLCDALIGLSGTEHTRDLTISIQPGGGEAEWQNIPLVHSFDAVMIPYLKSASNFYKGNYIIKNYQAYGVVTGMKHLQSEDFGVISVKSLVNGVERIISIQLDMIEYWEALVAHAQGRMVSCMGDLNVNPRSAQLLEPTKFSVSGAGGLFDD